MDKTKSTTRQELADAAGVSKSTICNWLAIIAKELKKMGVRKKQKVFTPMQTKFICSHFDISLGGERGGV